MDGTQFDALTRTLAHSGSRRRFLGAVLAGTFGLFASRDADAAGCRLVGEICREDANCYSGTCGTPDRRGRRYCDCSDVSDCPAPKVCRTVSCIDGNCVTSVVEPGATCITSNGDEGACQGASCVPTTTSTTTSTTTTSTTSTTSTTTSTTSTTTSTTSTTPDCLGPAGDCSSGRTCCVGCCDLGLCVSGDEFCA